MTLQSPYEYIRDKGADIRIKLTSVSREHVQIIIDENGQCVLNHLSKTNATLLNGKEVLGSVVLQNNDRIELGERAFCFKSGEHMGITNVLIMYLFLIKYN